MPTVWRRRREPTPDRRSRGPETQAACAGSVRKRRCGPESGRPAALSLCLSAQLRPAAAAGCCARDPAAPRRPADQQGPGTVWVRPRASDAPAVGCVVLLHRGTGESEERKEKGKEKAKRKPAARAASGATVAAIAERSGSSRRSICPGLAEPRTQTLSGAAAKNAPDAGHRATQSRREHVQGTANSVVSRSRRRAADCRRVRLQYDANVIVMTRHGPSSDPRQTSYSMTWRSAGCAAPSAPRGSYSMETSRLRWRVLRTTLMRPATCAAGCAALPKLSTRGERVSHVSRGPELRERAAEAAPSAGACGSRREHDGILRNAGMRATWSGDHPG